MRFSIQLHFSVLRINEEPNSGTTLPTSRRQAAAIEALFQDFLRSGEALSTRACVASSSRKHRIQRSALIHHLHINHWGTLLSSRKHRVQQHHLIAGIPILSAQKSGRQGKESTDLSPVCPENLWQLFPTIRHLHHTPHHNLTTLGHWREYSVRGQLMQTLFCS